MTYMPPDIGPKIRVLIVDDSMALRHALSDVLGDQHDITVVATAANARDGVDAAVTFNPDVVVLDISLPDGDGTTVARQIVRAVPDARIVAYSAFDRALLTRVMMSAGASAYISKSADIGQLLQAIRATQFETVGGSHE